MKQARKLILDLTNEDGNVSYLIQDIEHLGNIGDNTCQWVDTKDAKSVGEAVGIFLGMLFKNSSYKIDVLIRDTPLFGESSTMGGIEISTSMGKYKVKQNHYNDVLKNIVEHDYVYFIHDPKKSCTKIGKSKKVNQRLSSIRKERGSDCQLIHTVSCVQVDAYKLESLLHRLFKLEGKHNNGEWYDLDDDDIGWVSEFVDGYALLNSVKEEIRLNIKSDDLG